MLLKEGDMLGLILCAVSVLQERIRRERQSLIKGNTAGTGPPSEYVTSVLAFFIKHTMQRTRARSSVVICAIHTGHILARICIFSKTSKDV